MSFFALFHTGIGWLGLAVQMTLSRPALKRLGLAGTVALRPATVAISALVGLASPGLWSALVARGAHGVLNNSLFRSGYELLFTPIAERRKRPTKAIVDVGFDRIGTIVGSVIILALAAALGTQTPRVLFALAAASASGRGGRLPAAAQRLRRRPRGQPALGRGPARPGRRDGLHHVDDH